MIRHLALGNAECSQQASHGHGRCTWRQKVYASVNVLASDSAGVKGFWVKSFAVQMYTCIFQQNFLDPEGFAAILCCKFKIWFY